MSGSYLGSESDLTIVRASGILSALEGGERILGDKSYIGKPSIITPFKKWYQRGTVKTHWNSTLSSVRVIVEQVFSRFKTFKCLSSQWRHNLEKQRICFSVIAYIVNIWNLFEPVICYVSGEIDQNQDQQ